MCLVLQQFRIHDGTMYVAEPNFSYLRVPRRMPRCMQGA